MITGAIANSTSKAISKEVTSKIVTAEKEAAEAAYYSQKRANIAANSNSSRTKKIAEQAKIKAEATQMTVKKTVFWGNIKRSLTIPIQTTAKSVTEIVKDNDENEDKKEHK